MLSQLNRGAETKMELSLVDKIELARAYEPITSRIISLSIYLLAGESCFNKDTLKIYSEHVDSLRLSCTSSKPLGELSIHDDHFCSIQEGSEELSLSFQVPKALSHRLPSRQGLLRMLRLWLGSFWRSATSKATAAALQGVDWGWTTLERVIGCAEGLMCTQIKLFLEPALR